MKKLLFAGVAMLSALNGWAVAAQTYTNPNELPENFEWTMVRYDYRDGELVNTQDDIVVKWERDSYWTSTSSNPHVDHYGKLTITNFYRTECTKQESVTLEFENRSGRNFQWNVSDNTIVISFLAYYWSTSRQQVYCMLLLVPMALIQIVAILGQACQVADAKIAGA